MEPLTTSIPDTPKRQMFQIREQPKAFIIHCPRCGTFAASARTEGRAIRGIVRHLMVVHHVTEATSCQPAA